MFCHRFKHLLYCPICLEHIRCLWEQRQSNLLELDVYSAYPLLGIQAFVEQKFILSCSFRTKAMYVNKFIKLAVMKLAMLVVLLKG